MLKQRLYGLIMVVLGIFSAVYTGDGTAALMVVPMGLYAMFTKNYILTEDKDYASRNRSHKTHVKCERKKGA